MLCWYSGSGPDLVRLRLGNYIAADQRAGMGPQEESLYNVCGACYPKILWGYGVGLFSCLILKANERRLLAQARSVRCTLVGER